MFFEHFAMRCFKRKWEHTCTELFVSWYFYIHARSMARSVQFNLYLQRFMYPDPLSLDILKTRRLNRFGGGFFVDFSPCRCGSWRSRWKEAQDRVEVDHGLVKIVVEKIIHVLCGIFSTFLSHFAKKKARFHDLWLLHLAGFKQPGPAPSSSATSGWGARKSPGANWKGSSGRGGGVYQAELGGMWCNSLFGGEAKTCKNCKVISCYSISKTWYQLMYLSWYVNKHILLEFAQQKPKPWGSHNCSDLCCI